MVKKILFHLILLSIASCGLITEVVPFARYKFNRPYTMSLEIPDGPPEFQAGWYDGCRSGFSNSAFLNARMFMPMNAGTGVYQHDPVYQMAYGRALFSCVVQSGNFVSQPSYNMPLDPLSL